MEKSKPMPFVVIIENTSEEIKKAILFGGNDSSEKENFGCDNGITLKTGLPDITYLELLMQTIHKPFKVEKVEFHSTNEQLSLPICYTYYSIPVLDNGSGNMITNKSEMNKYQRPINLVNVNGCAEVNNIIDVIDDNTDISLSVLPKTILVVKLYPSEKSYVRPKIVGVSPKII